MMTETKTIELKRVNNGSNGNPRYVVHFLELLDNVDNEYLNGAYSRINQGYELALRKAKFIGGSKYRGKDFGGGIVIQSYNTPDLIKDIERFASDKQRLDWNKYLPARKEQKKFTKSKDNLRHDGQGNVFSYETFVAQQVGEYLVVADKYNSYSVTTTSHIGIAANELGLKRISEFEYHNRRTV